MRPEPLSFQVETFESFMLAGESAHFPMSFAFELRFDQALNISRLQIAVAACATRHPLLFSRLAADGKRWTFDESFQPNVTRDGTHEAMTIRLQNTSGLRIVTDGTGNSVHQIAFVFHHGCVDGLGALQFIRDVSSAYEVCLETNDSLPVLQVSPAESIGYLNRFRSSAGHNRLFHFLRWPLDLAGMIWAVEMVLNRPIAIEPSHSIEFDPAIEIDQGTSSETSNTQSDIHLKTWKRVFSEEESVQIKQRAKTSGQTINDRMMETFFLAIEAWNIRFNPANSGGLIRLMIPMSLRGKRVESAANMVAMINFDRKAGRWKSPKWFRRILRWEMSAVKFLRVGVTANRFLWMQKRILGCWPMQTKTDRCLASCLVSNLGQLSHHLHADASGQLLFGGLSLNRFHVTAPLRPHSNLFVCLYSHQQRLNLDVTFNPRVLNVAHVEFLLDAVQRHLLSEV